MLKIDSGMHIIAPAKLNLFLYIIGRDDRNYHILQSLFCKIPSLADELVIIVDDDVEGIKVETTYDDSLKCHHIIENNIVLRAAKSLLNLAEQNHLLTRNNYNAIIKLHKKIPIGSGLGGGSSDAAAVIIALNQLWEFNFSNNILLELGEQIGDDIKFFISSMNAMYLDGNRSCDITLGMKFPVLIVKPEYGVDTIAAYSYYREHYPTKSLCKMIACGDEIHHAVLQHVHSGSNDLYSAAVALRPQIVNVIDALQKQEGNVVARMSGSGSACFGIFDSNEAAMNAMNNIVKEYPTWWCHIDMITL